MKRWGIGFLFVLLSCIPIYTNRGTGAALLTDTDTAVLLRTIRETNRPFSWFAGDWPLHNHFYRPVPTLTFELDTRLYGDDAEGYGTTSAILVILCVFALFWFIRELTDKLILSTLASMLFAFWSGGSLYPAVGDALGYAFWVAAVMSIFFALKASITPGRKNDGLGPRALGLGEVREKEGLGPWALGLGEVREKEGLGPWALGLGEEREKGGLGPWALGLGEVREKEGLGPWALGLGGEKGVEPWALGLDAEKTEGLGGAKRTDDWRRARTAAAAALVLWYAAMEVTGNLVSNVSLLSTRMIGWLPSRTASVMTIFALVAMAAYARYERVSAERLLPEPSPLDPPATKNTRQGPAEKAPWIWAACAVVSAALAFASYEQAIMAPAALLGVAVLMRMQGFRVRWAWQAPFWLLLIGYFVLRKELLPAGVSRYEHQQLRYGPAVEQAILSYVFPTWGLFLQTVQSMGAGLGVFLSMDVYAGLLGFSANVAAFVAARKRLVFALAGWGLSILTFLPMAWLKFFPWYHFWPMAMRSIFAVTLCWIGFDLLVSAVSPQAVQAPPRRDPAPGSLPHP